MRLGVAIALLLTVVIGVCFIPTIQDDFWDVKYYSGKATQEDLWKPAWVGEELTLTAIDLDPPIVYEYSFHSKIWYDLGGKVSDLSWLAYALTSIWGLAILILLAFLIRGEKKQDAS